MDKVREIFDAHKQEIKNIYQDEGLNYIIKKCEENEKRLEERQALAREFRSFLYTTINHLLDKDRISIGKKWTIKDESIYQYGTSKLAKLEDFSNDCENRKLILEKIENNRDKEILKNIFRIIENNSDEIAVDYNLKYNVSQLENIPVEYSYIEKNSNVFVLHRRGDNEKEYNGNLFYCVKASDKKKSIEKSEEFFNKFSIKQPDENISEDELGRYVIYSDCISRIVEEEEQRLENEIEIIKNCLDSLVEEYESSVIASKI